MPEFGSIASHIHNNFMMICRAAATGDQSRPQ
jgi:hypothetical protein